MAIVAVGGISAFSIDGVNFSVASELSYEISITERETLTGLTNVDGYEEKPAPGKIEVAIRNNQGIDSSEFNAMTNVTVFVKLRNGKTVTGTGMWQTGKITFDPMASTIKLTFESGYVVEA